MTDPFLHEQWPQSVTKAGADFRAEHVRLLQFLAYIVDVASTLDARSHEAGEILRQLSSIVDVGDMQRERHATDDDGALETFRTKYKRICLEMMLVRSVDNFLTYLTDMLTSVFRAKPEALRTAEQVKIEEVLRHREMVDLVHFLVERRVNRLSFLGMRQLSEEIEEKLGFVLFTSAVALNEAVRIAEDRNLLVHARGKVNRLYLERVAAAGFGLGATLEVTGKSVFQDMQFLATAVIDVDGRATSKFGLSVDGNSDDTGFQNAV